MKRIYLFLIILLLSISLYGCSQDTKANQVDFDLIASEATSPVDDLDEPHIEKISDQSEFEATWTMYRLKDVIPHVNFDEKDVYFIMVNGSSSCPYTIETINTSKDKAELIVSLSSPDGNCTSDLVPRTIVIQTDKKITGHIDHAKIVR